MKPLEQVNRMRTPEINLSLEVSISRDRLEKYLADQDDNLDKALALYERNMQLSAAFYPALQCLEVCLRNKIHSTMQKLSDVSTRGTDLRFS